MHSVVPQSSWHGHLPLGDCVRQMPTVFIWEKEARLQLERVAQSNNCVSSIEGISKHIVYSLSLTGGGVCCALFRKPESFKTEVWRKTIETQRSNGCMCLHFPLVLRESQGRLLNVPFKKHHKVWFMAVRKESKSPSLLVNPHLTQLAWPKDCSESFPFPATSSSTRPVSPPSGHPPKASEGPHGVMGRALGTKG